MYDEMAGLFRNVEEMEEVIEDAREALRAMANEQARRAGLFAGSQASFGKGRASHGSGRGGHGGGHGKGYGYGRA